MAVKLVIFDCDRTLWDHPDVSELRPPFRKVAEDAVEDAHGERVQLFAGTRTALEALRAREILISVASWNQPEPVFAIFDLLTLDQYFTQPKVEFHPHKDHMVRDLLAELAAEGITLHPEEILFVDDNPAHLDAVRAAIGPLRTLQMGAEIDDPLDVLTHLD